MGRKINMNYNLFYYIGCNDIKVDSGLLNKYKLIHKTFFYQNSHGDNFFNFADYFFPSYSFLEKQSGYYINCFGIFKKNRQLVLPRNEFVQDDKDIVRLIHKMIFYNILENQITYSSVYFYVYSSKNKNSFKNSIFATYSANLNMISYLHFSKKSNLTL